MRNITIEIQNRINAGIETVRNCGVVMGDVVCASLSSLTLRHQCDGHAEHDLFAYAYPGSQASEQAAGMQAKSKFRPTTPTLALASWCATAARFLPGNIRQQRCPAVSAGVGRIS